MTHWFVGNLAQGQQLLTPDFTGLVTTAAVLRTLYTNKIVGPSSAVQEYTHEKSYLAPNTRVPLDRAVDNVAKLLLDGRWLRAEGVVDGEDVAASVPHFLDAGDGPRLDATAARLGTDGEFGDVPSRWTGVVVAGPDQHLRPLHPTAVDRCNWDLGHCLRAHNLGFLQIGRTLSAKLPGLLIFAKGEGRREGILINVPGCPLGMSQSTLSSLRPSIHSSPFCHGRHRR